MRPILLLICICALLSFPAGCADINTCPPGRYLEDGACKVEPIVRPREEYISTFCRLAPDIRSNAAEQPTLEFGNRILRVAPLERIVAGESFAVRLSGYVEYGLSYVNGSVASLPGGVGRLALRELNATVSVRRGASPTGPPPVLKPKATTPPSVESCTYDEQGESGPLAGPFPTCSHNDDNADGSNDACTGLGGQPSPYNRCLPFLTFTRSDDCSEGGVCDSIDQTGPGSVCEIVGFCATEPVLIELEETVATYIADDEDAVLFGWAEIGDEIADGPNKGVIELPEPLVSGPAGPNGLRIQADALPLAAECSMGVDSKGLYGVDSVISGHSRIPDSLLIALAVVPR